MLIYSTSIRDYDNHRIPTIQVVHIYVLKIIKILYCNTKKSIFNTFKSVTEICKIITLLVSIVKYG